jgi:hypothetical protein
VPNPPPWRIDYLNDGGLTALLPEARTIGLTRFDIPELCIKKVPPSLAASVLDRVAIWLVYENQYSSMRFESNEYEFAGLSLILEKVNQDLLEVKWKHK